MSVDLPIDTTELVYKIACLIAGTLIVALGYRLFMAGIWGQAGDLDMNFASTKIVLKKAAPGTFFAVLGAVVILTTIFKGLELTDIQSPQVSPTAAQTPPAVPLNLVK